MNVLSWILFGLITGIIAHMLDTRENDLLTALILGVGGALTGGLLANVLLGMSFTGFNITSFLLSAASALLIVVISRTLKKV